MTATNSLNRTYGKSYIVAICIACLGVVVGCSFVAQSYRLRILDEVKTQLSRIDGINVVDIGGYFDDGLLLEHIYAEVEVVGRGRMHFMGLTKEAFLDGGTFYISRVGDWTPAVNRAGVQRRPDVLGCGVGGESAVLLLNPVTTVRRAIEQYDEVLAAVTSWPEYPRISRTSDSKSEITFSRKRFGEHVMIKLEKRY